MKSAFYFLMVHIVCLLTSNTFMHLDSNMFLELVSIIVNFIFLSSLLLLYHISHASGSFPKYFIIQTAFPVSTGHLLGKDISYTKMTILRGPWSLLALAEMAEWPCL